MFPKFILCQVRCFVSDRAGVPQSLKLGQSSTSLTFVKLGEGWGKCLSQNEARSSSLKVEVLGFR